MRKLGLIFSLAAAIFVAAPVFGQGVTGSAMRGVVGTITDIIFPSGKGLKTGKTAGNTFTFQAYDTNDSLYRTFCTATAGTTPSFDCVAPSGGTISFRPTLTSAHIMVGNGSNIATDVAVGGDCTMANTGALTCTSSGSSSSTITNDITTNATMFPVWVTANTGSLPLKVSSTKMSFNPSTGTLTATTVAAALTGNATTATSLATARAIYGNNFDGSAALTQVIASTYGGTGNGFTKFTGATTSEKTYTLPNSSETILYSGGALGTPSSATLTNATGLPLSGLATQATNTVAGNATSGTAVPTALAVGTCSTAGSALNWTTNTGFGCNTSITAANVPVGGITGLGTGVGTFLATPSSANLRGALTDEINSGVAIFAPVAGENGFNRFNNYVTGRFYLGGAPGTTVTSTNTTPLVTSTQYAVPGYAHAPLSIHSITVATSTTNASLTASVKACVYAADGTNGAPGTLLGSTASGTVIGDAATSTAYNIVLDANTDVVWGKFYVALLATSTTGPRFQVSSGGGAIGQAEGATAAGGIIGASALVYGYTMSQTYASGCASPWVGTTVNSTIGLAPAFEFEIH